MNPKSFIRSGIIWGVLFAGPALGDDWIKRVAECLTSLVRLPKNRASIFPPTATVSVVFKGQNFLVPRNVPPSAYLVFLETLPQLRAEKWDALILYGSQTHHAYGYPTHANGDLDFLAVPIDTPAARAAGEWQTVFDPMPVHVIQVQGPLQRILDLNTFRHPADAAAEQALFAQSRDRDRARWQSRYRGLRLSTLPNLSPAERDLRSLCYELGTPLDFISVGKQATIFLFNPETAASTRDELAKRGYFQVYDFSSPD